MEQLKVIGTEDDALVLATESGERFRSPSTTCCASSCAKRARDRDGDAQVVAPSPREIQSHIRAGMSAEEVARSARARASKTSPRSRARCSPSASTSSVRRSPCPCCSARELDPDAHPTFGAAVRAKLAEAGASGERWTSWKEATGWVVKLEFTANEVDHDARWGFDPRRSTLSPLNADAIQLSRQGSLPEGLIPRLRALRVDAAKDDTRFDSGAFGPRRIAGCRPRVARLREPVAPAVQEAAMKRADASAVTSPRPPTCSRRCGAVAGSASRCPDAEECLARAPSSGRAVRCARARLRRVARDDFERRARAARPSRPPSPRRRAAQGPHVDAVVGRDRLRRAHRRTSRPQANAPRRMSGTVRSSSVSEPCWPTMRWAPLSSSRSS